MKKTELGEQNSIVWCGESSNFKSDPNFSLSNRCGEKLLILLMENTAKFKSFFSATVVVRSLNHPTPAPAMTIASSLETAAKTLGITLQHWMVQLLYTVFTKQASVRQRPVSAISAEPVQHVPMHR